MSVSIKLPSNCIQAKFQARVKRFTIVAKKQDKTILAHTNNSGSMLGLLKTNNPVLLSPATNPKRKLPFTLELIKVNNFWVGVNTSIPNKMLKLIWEHQLIYEWTNYSYFQPEVKLGQHRIDAKLDGVHGSLWIEAKNVTLVEDDIAYFPDAPSQRAREHLAKLIHLVKQGQKAACFYLIQRPDGKCFGPADFIDKQFAQLFWQAIDAGVQVYSFQAIITPSKIQLGRQLKLAPRFR